MLHAVDWCCNRQVKKTKALNSHKGKVRYLVDQHRCTQVYQVKLKTHRRRRRPSPRAFCVSCPLPDSRRTCPHLALPTSRSTSSRSSRILAPCFGHDFLADRGRSKPIPCAAQVYYRTAGLQDYRSSSSSASSSSRAVKEAFSYPFSFRSLTSPAVLCPLYALAAWDKWHSRCDMVWHHVTNGGTCDMRRDEGT